MNRTEYDLLLSQVMEDVNNPIANFRARFAETGLTPEQEKAVVGIALMAVDRYYQHLSTRRSQLQEP